MLGDFLLQKRAEPASEARCPGDWARHLLLPGLTQPCHSPAGLHVWGALSPSLFAPLSGEGRGAGPGSSPSGLAGQGPRLTASCTDGTEVKGRDRYLRLHRVGSSEDPFLSLAVEIPQIKTQQISRFLLPRDLETSGRVPACP